MKILRHLFATIKTNKTNNKDIALPSFCPLKNITAYELAILVPIMIPKTYRTKENLTEQCKELPPNVKRHIKFEE